MQDELLWQSDDVQRGLDYRLARAVSRFEGKYGVKPDQVLVHPDVTGEEVLGMKMVRSSRAHHANIFILRSTN